MNPFANWPVGTAVESSTEVPCWNCKGTGKVPIFQAFDDDLTEFTCPKCNSTGSYHEVRLLLNPGGDFLGPIDVTTLADQNRLNSPPEPDVIVKEKL